MSRLIAVLLLAVVSASGCASRASTLDSEPVLGAARAEHPAAPRDDALFIALGGHAGIDSLTERIIREIAADEDIRGRFSRTDISRFGGVTFALIVNVPDRTAAYSCATSSATVLSALPITIVSPASTSGSMRSA